MYAFYVTITGKTQGAFSGEATGKHAGKLVGLAFEQASSAPAKGSGKPVFGPVRFTRQWGAASPQLLQALATAEPLTTVRFEFVRSNEEGEEVVFHCITLAGARVTGLRPFIDLDAEPSSLMPLPPLEEVEISFAGLAVENLAGKTAAEVGATGKGRKGKPPARTRPAARRRARTG